MTACTKSYIPLRDVLLRDLSYGCSQSVPPPERVTDYTGLPTYIIVHQSTFNQARETIRQLTEELKAKKTSEQAAPATQSNGHQVPPAAQETTVRMIEDKQFDTLLNLYGKLDIELPDVSKWSFEQAQVGIKELSKQLNEKLKAAKAS